MTTPAFDELPEGRDEEAADWCQRLSESELTPSEQKLFEAWLGDPANAQALDEAVVLWRAVEAASSRPVLIMERAAALDRLRKANARRWMRGFSRPWRRASAVAAALFVALLGSILILHNAGQQYETEIGERRVAMLEDGSRLSLDAATLVNVRIADDKRQMTLKSGRAKFDVAKDPLRPFSVEAGDKLIVATGTSFSVELLGNEVRVLLYEGHVDVLDRPHGKAELRQVEVPRANTPAAQALTPGHELVVPLFEASAIIDPADLSRSLDWESGQLSFDNEPLPTAVERMNRYSREKLRLGDPSLQTMRINGVFSAGNMDSFVEGLSALYGLNMTRKDGQLVLTRG